MVKFTKLAYSFLKSDNQCVLEKQKENKAQLYRITKQI
jgi:hypothetical protein